jgi:putative Mn2+ efflux pump MntP
MDASSLLTVSGLGLGLAMDAVAVSVAAGLAKQPLAPRDAPLMALTFGGFQALMPLLGWALGHAARASVAAWDHWIAFGLLTLVGGKMAWEWWHHDPERLRGDPFAPSRLLVSGLATSIDALAVGVTLALQGLPLLLSAGIIGLITFALCLPAVRLGARLGERFARWSELAGGLVLIGFGAKILAAGLAGAG